MHTSVFGYASNPAPWQAWIGRRTTPSSPDGRGTSQMTPTIGDDQRLRDILLAAKRGRNFGRGNVDEQIKHVEPLIKALEESLRTNRDGRDLVKQLLDTVWERPIMPTDPMMGAEPLCYRWQVLKPAEFDKVIMRLRAKFPEAL